MIINLIRIRIVLIFVGKHTAGFVKLPLSTKRERYAYKNKFLNHFNLEILFTVQKVSVDLELDTYRYVVDRSLAAILCNY